MTAYIDSKQNIYFKGKDVATVLGYENTDKAIRDHVDEEYMIERRDIKGGPNRSPLQDIQLHTIFITEPGVYSLIFSSKMEKAKLFQKWVFSDVLPTIRKYGYYRMFNNPKTLAFKIQDEHDLHVKVVNYIRRFYPGVIMTAGLGELQRSASMRIESFKKGYQKGQPDLIINNCHKRYNGCVLNSKRHSVMVYCLKRRERELLERYEDNGYMCIVSNDYDLIIKELNDNLKDVRVKRMYCNRKFISKRTLRKHKKYFHKIMA